DEEGEAPACPGCGAEVDPTWAACPYCQTALGGGGAPAGGPPVPKPAGGAPAPGPDMPVGPGGNRTMAIDLDALGAPKKPVRGWLVIVEGQQKGTDFRIYEGVNKIGAGADNDIVVTDDYLSTHHCSIRIENNVYEFVDNGSTNGSYVNDRRVSKEEVIDNDRLRLGRTEFRIKTLLEY
ncbi:MAG: FHA domain-containing protein, partial [Myxococcales bacterium]|nr:FHA domain-containing protein [Myxococcales bacterium]